MVMRGAALFSRLGCEIRAGIHASSCITVMMQQKNRAGQRLHSRNVINLWSDSNP
jgi:hypothetical protein